MRCSKAQKYVSQDLDGVLPPAAAVGLQEHLDECAACRSYREDLQLGSRILAATEPELPDNFDWKLQLRLNQALKETAGEVAYPWHDSQPGPWDWVRNFGTAAAFGMAAVLAVAIFVGPVENTGSNRPVQETVAATSDRLPLEPAFNLTRGLGRPVSSASPFQPEVSRTQILDRGWSGQNLEDLRTIYRLRADNEKLRRMLVHSTRQMQLMRAQLDSTEDNALDLQEDGR